MVRSVLRSVEGERMSGVSVAWLQALGAAEAG